MQLITCTDLALGYEGKEIASGLSFTVEEGSYLCIVGENGSGKSTLIKTILGLQAPLEGSIEMGGGLEQTAIGYLPQQTDVQKDFPASVREVVLSGCLNRSGVFYRRPERQRAQEAMDRLGIEGLARKCYRELSGGQQQRVLLARALCATKKLLLLDEPIAGLDPNAASSLYRMLAELNGQDGITVVMVSHDIGPALHDASHVLHIGNGRALFFGSKADYEASPPRKGYGALQGGVA